MDGIKKTSVLFFGILLYLFNYFKNKMLRQSVITVANLKTE